MEKKFYIIMGRSGSGKGTQSELLKTYLESKGAENVLHVTTGGAFREFITGKSLAATTTQNLINTGGSAPEFLAVWVWSNIFINIITGKETILLDGAPRKIVEAMALRGAIRFFGYDNPTIVYINVSETWAMDKLTSRGREDDKKIAEQERKMMWFNEDVLPCVDVYKHDPIYTFVHVNGEQSVEEVHNELVAKLNLA